MPSTAAARGRREDAVASGPTLVTGATGFAGSHLLDRLAGQELVCWHRPGGHPPGRARPVDWQAVEIVDQNAVARAIARSRPARIYHLAGAPSVGSSWKNATPCLQANALGTHHLLEAVRRTGLSCRILVVSSAQVYQPGNRALNESAALIPSNPYGLSKLAADALALRAFEDDGLDVVLARPFNHAGPRQSAAYAIAGFARQIARIEAGLEPAVIKVGELGTRRDFTDVRDVVRAYELLMDRAPAGRPYNICTGRAERIGDVLDALVRMASVAVRIERDPARLRPNDVPIFLGDATRIRAELGWAPAIGLEQTLKDTLGWWTATTRSAGGA
jgi:GDP-4-dehydro-6-deoxy-D-mannose reductase